MAAVLRPGATAAAGVDVDVGDVGAGGGPAETMTVTTSSQREIQQFEKWGSLVARWVQMHPQWVEKNFWSRSSI